MSANHNRIRVADLEKNQPDKILITNQNGELEFSNISKLQSNYNVLDYTTEGKALDARQGKVLKDFIDNINVSPTLLVNDLTTGGTSKALTAEMEKTLDNTKLTASLATDAETQMTIAVPEDKKVVSRLKLFNWWEWLKSRSQTISGNWNFTNKVTLVSGSTTTPSLIIPSGTLTTPTQNGAIERDSNGQLWETHNGVRSRFITTADGIILVPFKANYSIQTNITGTVSATAQSISSSTVIGSIKNSSVLRLNLVNEVYFLPNSPLLGTIEPQNAKIEVYLKINNGLFATNYIGASTTNQVKIIELSGLKNNGLKDYQSIFLTAIQNQDPLLAQWSTVQFFTQNIKDGVITNGEATYYLRDTLNSKAFGAAEASFSFVFVNTVTYADSANTAGQNISRIIRSNNLALYLETIR